ncbi:hypothetical protein IAU59_007274 [Kwoniella sp. CBS 9459]
MVHPLSNPTSFLLATTLSFFLAPSSVSAHRNLPRRPQPHPHPHPHVQLQQLDERLLPITATTTVVVQKTATYTVWVKPTDQVIFPGDDSGSGSGPGNGGEGSSSSSSAAESSVTASASANASASVSAESSGSLSAAPSGETSEVYPTASASASSSASTTSSYDGAAASSSSLSASASPSASASGSGSAGSPSETYISDSAFPTSSLASASIDPTASYSYSDSYSSDYGYPTSSFSATGYETESTATASASESASTESSSSSSSASDSHSHSHSASATATASASETQSVTGSQAEESSSSSYIISSSESRSASSTSSTATASVTGTDTASLTSTASVSVETDASTTANGTASMTVSESTTSSFADESVTSTTTAWWETASASATATTTGNLSSWTESLSDTESIVPTATSLLSVTASLTATSTSAAATASSTSTLETLPRTLMNAYYPDWSGWYLPPESVDWSRFDVIDFAFALPTAEFGLQFTQDNSADLLNRLVKLAHAAGKRVKLSVGGWTGSVYFSTICASSTNRQTFVKAMVEAYDLYNLDGIDIDWEYPGTTGAEGNAVSSSDSANFLLLLQELRAALPDGALISLATQVWPFADTNGRPMSDVSAFASVIDWILIMNYDVWGSSSTPGPNAPLSDGCGNSTQPLANAYAAVSSWTGAGMPASKITLGVPAYGYLQKSTASSLKQRRSSFPLPPHKLLRSANATSHQARDSSVTVYNDNGGSSDGQVMFESLISQGALTWENGGYVGASGFTRHWDSCSSTPWLKSEHSGQIITYDDPQSMNLKGQFAAQVGLRGCNIFSIDGDWTGSSWPLTDSVRSGLGI